MRYPSVWDQWTCSPPPYALLENNRDSQYKRGILINTKNYNYILFFSHQDLLEKVEIYCNQCVIHTCIARSSNTKVNFMFSPARHKFC
mmetsp:Transcript_19683/g.30282  ORF Transcript_19683/g.30282 Transcript_19683/m.30282 type:complete len:88 (+) Transcript_19683:113-376(+)